MYYRYLINEIRKQKFKFLIDWSKPAETAMPFWQKWIADHFPWFQVLINHFTVIIVKMSGELNIFFVPTQNFMWIKKLKRYSRLEMTGRLSSFWCVRLVLSRRCIPDWMRVQDLTWLKHIALKRSHRLSLKKPKFARLFFKRD